MQRRAVLFALAASILLGAGIVVGALLGSASDDGGGPSSDRPVAEATATPSSSRATSRRTGEGSACLSAAEIYERLRPAVVEVLVSGSSGSPFGLPVEGAGSGVVVDEEGTILTNHHVVAGAERVEVRFEDGTVVEANVLGRDPGNDLALVRVEEVPDELAVAPLGRSSDLRVGEPVLAIGNPFNLEGTLTQGIVSALGRTFASGGNAQPLRNLIQTDASVNPGNSGGPLINCHAEVVGINTLLENPTGDNVNVGVAFAVPIDTAQRSLPQMRAGQTVRHPWLGIAGLELTPALAEELGLSTDAGVYVTLVVPRSPADEAGLRGAFASEEEAAAARTPVPGGDVIVRADGRAVLSVEQLASYLDERKAPGDRVTLDVVRDGTERSVEATLAEWPA